MSNLKHQNIHELEISKKRCEAYINKLKSIISGQETKLDWINKYIDERLEEADLEGMEMPSKPKDLSKGFTNVVEQPFTKKGTRVVVFTDTGYEHSIVNPVKLFYKVNSNTHTIVDSEGTKHAFPNPSTGKVVIKWIPEK